MHNRYVENMVVFQNSLLTYFTESNTCLNLWNWHHKKSTPDHFGPGTTLDCSQ